MNKKPLVLVILDGFGYRDNPAYNAVAHASTPVWDALWENHPNTLIDTSGLAVGLPEGQMGNSEVGHITLGAGRVIYQNFTRINKAIEEGDFTSNSAYCSAIDDAIACGGAVHILGLLSEGGVHSHQNHINAAIELAAQRGAQRIYLHAFLDGRDCPPRSARPSLNKTHALFESLGVGRIASIIGRFYALDRDNRWDRVAKAYQLITHAQADYTSLDPLAALDAAYAREENDEFVSATVVRGSDQPEAKVSDNDAVIFMNFRPDRARELTHALVDGADFKGFDRGETPQIKNFVMTTEYEACLDYPCAFPPKEIVNSLGEYLAKHNKSQLRIAETEKYAHVTFFFNGGQETLFDGEERVLLASPNVATYDLQPQMSTPEITEKLVEAIQSERFNVIICNYANCDMVGHTGSFSAAKLAVESVDRALSEVLEALAKTGGEALVTADHGNVEQMFDPVINQPHTQHTTLPVPCVYFGNSNIQLRSGGSLADVAPTLLALLGLPQPDEMTGQSLIKQ